MSAGYEPRDGFGQVLHDAWTIASKDLKVEVRSKEILLTMGYFGFMVVLIGSFTFFKGEAPLSSVASGILWISIAFSGTLGLGRVFEREREGDCIRALLLTPVARPAIYLGKTLGVLTFMFVVELIVIPSVIFFFSIPINTALVGRLIATVGLGSIGYSIVGTLLAAMLLRAHSKDVLLGIVFYPIIMPVLIVGVKATTALLEQGGGTVAEFGQWMSVLGFFDLVFLVASLWLFEVLLID